MKSRKKQLGFWGAVAGAAIGALGSYLSSKESQNAADDRYASSIELANTAHQREVADLQAAGLNPILSVNRGGAAMPPANMIGNFPNYLGDGVNTGFGIYKTEAEENKIRQEIDRIKQEMRYKEPLAKIGDEASKGVDFIKEGVKGAVEPVMDFLKDVTGFGEMLKKQAESQSAWAAGAAGRVSEAAKGFAESAQRGLIDSANTIKDKAGEVLSIPKSLAEHGVTSAADFFRQSVKPAERTGIVDRTWQGVRYKLDETAFTGHRPTDLKAIAGIKDPVDRARVMLAYRMWQDQFPNKVKWR